MEKAAFIAAILSVFAGDFARAQDYRFEAEQGTLGGSFIATNTPGYSGSGFVSFHNATAEYVQVQAAVPEGLYELWIGYNSRFGFKGYEFQVNDVGGSGGFDETGTNQWALDRAGTFDLSGATNTLRIDRGWGWYNVDYFELRPFTPPPLQSIPATLANPNADRHTQMLMNYLASQYGHKTLSGQQHQSSQNLAFPVASYLSKSGGIVPAIRVGDFMDYSPSRTQFGANPRSESEQTIAWAKQNGGIVSMSWHWNAPSNLVNAGDWPWWRGFYTNGTTFNLPAALANPAGGDYQLIVRDIDAIAVELQKFETAGVPVIWRPLHEAQGGWFWWGAHGPETFKQLWHLMYDRLTNHHGLDNLIWEFTSSAAEGNHLDWYPGDDVVDMIGLDVYTDPTSTMSGQWLDILEHYNGRKLIALSETGTLPNADAMDRWGIDWSYFSPWNGTFVDAMSPAELQALLNHEDIVTLTDLPTLPWSNLAAALPGDYNGDGHVDAADYTVWRNAMGNPNADLAADGNGNGTIDAGDYDVWKLYYGEALAGVGSLATVPEPHSLGLLVLATIALGHANLRTIRSWR